MRAAHVEPKQDDPLSTEVNCGHDPSQSGVGSAVHALKLIDARNLNDRISPASELWFMMTPPSAIR